MRYEAAYLIETKNPMFGMRKETNPMAIFRRNEKGFAAYCEDVTTRSGNHTQGHHFNLTSSRRISSSSDLFEIRAKDNKLLSESPTVIRDWRNAIRI